MLIIQVRNQINHKNHINNINKNVNKKNLYKNRNIKIITYRIIIIIIIIQEV